MNLEYGDYTIRPLEEKDLRMVLEWRNSDRIHSVMLTDHKITWDEHYAWFQRNKNNNPSRNLVFCYKGRPVGYIGYTEYDEVNKSCSPGAYLGEIEGIPSEAGIFLFRLSVIYAFKILDMQILRTEIIKSNKQSMLISKYLKYKIVGENTVFKNKVLIDTYIMELNRQDSKFL